MLQVPHILVIDDDARLRRLLHDYLSKSSFCVSESADTKDARIALKEIVFDAIILDIMMPDETGLDFLIHLRKQYSTPVLMLTAMGDAENRIEGLERGADDYLVKPFEPRELVLRLQKLIGRNRVEARKSIHFNDYSFDITEKALSRNGMQIYLTETENDLLSLLAESSGDVVSRDVLADKLSTTAKSVDVMIGRLRKKIGDDSKTPIAIITVRGEGYCLKGY